MRKLLMFLYRFPPMGGSGVQRGLKFVKYLPTFGWEPVVITASGGVDISQDRGLNADVPRHIKQYRFPSLEPAMTRVLRYRLERNAAERGDMRARPWAGSGRLIRMLRSIRVVLSYAMVPDEQVIWSSVATVAAIRIARSHGIDAVFASARPFSVLLGAEAIGRLLGVPVIADIRDPLTDGIDYCFNRVRRLLDRRLERLALANASAVVCVNEALCDHYRFSHSGLRNIRYVTIPNGYDEEDFRAAGPKRATFTGGIPDSVTLAHVGQVYPGAVRPLVDLLLWLRSTEPELFSRLSVRLVGGIPLPEGDGELLSGSGLLQKVILLPRVAHASAIAEMMQADILLILRPMEFDAPHMGAGKAYEYLRCGKPVLALAPGAGVIGRLLEESRLGKSFAGTEIASAGKHLIDLVQSRLELSPDWRYIRQFERRELTRSLAQVLEAACAEKASVH